MTMTSPKCYIDNLKNEPFEVLIKERNKLIQEIKYFEKHKKEIMNDELKVFPSPDTIYGWNLQALGYLCQLMSDKVFESDEQKSIINIKFEGKKYKIIYAEDIKIEYLDDSDKYSETELSELKHIIQMIDDTYRGPQDGFPVSRMAHLLPEYDVELISYYDYQMKNDEPGTVY